MFRRRLRSYSRWAGAGLVLLAAIAAWLAWNQSRQPAGTAESPATQLAEKSRVPPKPQAGSGGAAERQVQTGARVPERPPRERTDRPGDDKPEIEQWRRQSAREFRGADTDGDGYLSRDEARHFSHIATEFERADADGDGRVSLEEFMGLRRWQAQQQMQK
jgi:hypothetical protein